jgi:hypothetical protein
MGHDTLGTHLFEFSITSNDPIEPVKYFYLKIDYVAEEKAASDS